MEIKNKYRYYISVYRTIGFNVLSDLDFEIFMKDLLSNKWYYYQDCVINTERIVYVNQYKIGDTK